MSEIQFKYGYASCRLLFIEPDYYAVTNVYSPVLKEGYGRGLMQKVVDYADEHNFTLLLIPKRYGYSNAKALDNQQLEVFYSKFGFITDANSGTPPSMTRLPRRKNTAYYEKEDPFIGP